MKFVPISEVLKGKLTGEVSLRGWVYRKREQKEIVFIVLRDVSGTIQVAVKDKKLLAGAKRATTESSLELKGTVKEDKRAPGGYEIEAKQLKIIGMAERFPIVKDQSEDFLREVRHLWIRSRRMTAMLKVRSCVFQAIHEFYKGRGFYEVQSPIFTTLGCEGGSTLFEVKYGKRKGVYLSQSWQLYAEAMIFALERIYTIAPSFRAEKSRTIRHLSEYWHHEMEAAWMGHEELMRFEEDLILFIVKYVLRHCKKEMEELRAPIDMLKKLKKPFMRMSYKEMIRRLGKKHGHDITDKEERELVAGIGEPVFLHSFPRDMKAFYMRPDPRDPKVVLASDLLLPGVGETIGGSERISDEKELLKSLKMYKLPKKDYHWYLDLTKYGAIPHSGFGLGIERLVMFLTGAKHIFETIPFPRTMDRVTP